MIYLLTSRDKNPQFILLNNSVEECQDDLLTSRDKNPQFILLKNSVEMFQDDVLHSRGKNPQSFCWKIHGLQINKDVEQYVGIVKTCHLSWVVVGIHSTGKRQNMGVFHNEPAKTLEHDWT